MDKVTLLIKDRKTGETVSEWRNYDSFKVLGDIFTIYDYIGEYRYSLLDYIVDTFIG